VSSGHVRDEVGLLKAGVGAVRTRKRLLLPAIISDVSEQIGAVLVRLAAIVALKVALLI
jgi:hypothetical protein